MTPEAFGTLIGAIALCVVAYIMGHSEGEYRGVLAAMVDAEKDRAALTTHWQRRVRGILAEARRWKDVAVSLGWKRETRGEMHARQRQEAGET